MGTDGEPKTVKELANTLIMIIDSYQNGEIDLIATEKRIVYLAAFKTDLLIKGGVINTSIERKIGKKRIDIMINILGHLVPRNPAGEIRRKEG